MKTVTALYLSTAVLGATLMPLHAMAQQYPSKPIRWVVPYAAGGGSDATARIIAQAMSKSMGQPIVVENKPGAGTQIGAQAVATSAPDGYTVGTADSGTLAYNPSLYKKLSYDVDKSFSYVGGIARMPLVLVTRPDFGAGSLKEFIAAAKKEPNKVNYASAGAGSPHHVAGAMLEQEAKIQMVHVPYKGAAPGLQDVMGGQVDAMLLDLPGGMSAMKTGKVKLIAVAMPKRVSQLPDVPTMAEAGLPGFVAYAWQGMVAPAGTPPAVVQRLNAELKKALQDPEVRTKLDASGIDPMVMTVAEFSALAKAEQTRWEPIIKSANITVD